MRKIFFLAISALVTFVVSAVPAVPGVLEATQPDGTTLLVRIMGDEFFNFQTTADGYTIMKNTNGYYVYAIKNGNDLIASNVIARNENMRTATEQTFLKGLSKRLISDTKANEGKVKRAKADYATREDGLKTTTYDYNNFKGLIILVDYSDIHFSRSDMQQFYNLMVNEQGYTGFTNEDGSSNPYGACTGSVRDYFYDNSQGRFAPTFDVYGPVTLNNYSSNSHNQTSGSGAIWAAALRALDSQIDYSQYDTDNDGNIDMVFFIGAGSGSNSDSSNPQHLWPHKSDLYWQNLTLDDKRFRTYACSTEYLYNSINGIIDGIGTICHEFSHVLGLPDLYDTDYAQSGGQSQHPGEWEIMAGGCYQNNSRTPVAYSLYDRYSIGFANAQKITGKGKYTLHQIGSTGEGYILDSPESNVKFYIENRQKTRWDTEAPGHGMLVYRVDSTSTYAWESNNPNSNPSHNYYVMLRAGNGTENAQESDAFPAGGTNLISNLTTPSLVTFNGKSCQHNITNIREEDGVIYFSIGDYPSLATLLSDGVNDEDCIISNDLAVVDYADYADYVFLTDGEDNWINVTASTDILNQLISMNTVKGGTLVASVSDIDLNPVITATVAPEASENIIEYQVVAYNLADTFAPKVNQVIDVTGYWNASEGNMRGYSSGGQSMTLDTSWGSNTNTLQNGKRYTVRCAMNIKEPWEAPALGIAPKSYDYDFQNYIGYALRMPDTPTAIETISTNNDNIVNVYNMQGQLLKHNVETTAATQGLRPGIYLIGAKKVVVK